MHSDDIVRISQVTHVQNDYIVAHLTTNGPKTSHVGMQNRQKNILALSRKIYDKIVSEKLWATYHLVIK